MADGPNTANFSTEQVETTAEQTHSLGHIATACHGEGFSASARDSLERLPELKHRLAHRRYLKPPCFLGCMPPAVGLSSHFKLGRTFEQGLAAETGPSGLRREPDAVEKSYMAL